MKIKIINNTNLEFATLGSIIDSTIKHSYADTIYYGKVEFGVIEVGSHMIEIEIEYLKRYVVWKFSEVKWKTKIGS